MRPWRVKMPTQNLLRLLLLLMLMMRIVLATVCCRFRSWGLVKKLNFCSDWLSTRFGQDFEVEVEARFEAGMIWRIATLLVWLSSGWCLWKWQGPAGTFPHCVTFSSLRVAQLDTRFAMIQIWLPASAGACLTRHCLVGTTTPHSS